MANILTIKEIVSWINTQLAPLVPGTQFYGIAKPAIRDEKLMPVEGEKYIGLNDAFPMQVYHKEFGLSSTEMQGSGYGDNVKNIMNSHAMAMIIYYNTAKARAGTDQLYMLVQKKISGILKSPGIKYARIIVTSAILEDARVYQQEYGVGPVRLKATQRLIQVNYTVQIVFDKNCTPACMPVCT
jgi:hypothetical protein